MKQEEHNNTGAQNSISQYSGIDEQLLARNNKSDKEGGAEQKAIVKKKSALSLRQRVFQAQREKRKRQLELKKKKSKFKKPNPAQKATASLLKKAWLSVINTFGLSLIYVNIHAWMAIWWESTFCQLGDEWTMGMKGGALKKANKSIQIYEKMGLIGIDLVCCSCLLLIIVFFTFLIYAYNHIWEMVGIISKQIWEMIKNNL